MGEMHDEHHGKTVRGPIGDLASGPVGWICRDWPALWPAGHAVAGIKLHIGFVVLNALPLDKRIVIQYKAGGILMPASTKSLRQMADIIIADGAK
jgi:hypothetical protein